MIRQVWLLALVACGGSEPLTAHVVLGESLVASVAAEQNHYGEPAELDATHAVTKCGSFVSELLRQAYPDLDVRALTGMGSADAEHWYEAISTEASAGAYGLEHVMALRPGDLFASRYDSGDATGHVLVVIGTPYPTSGLLPGAHYVEVLDSTQSPHGDDTRAPAGEGIGRGWIRLYLDGAGGIVAWQWSLDANADVYVNGPVPEGCVAPVGHECLSRPVVVGRLVR